MEETDPESNENYVVVDGVLDYDFNQVAYFIVDLRNDFENVNDGKQKLVDY